jgi:hypothetical protein
MLIHKYPARLVDERRVFVSFIRRLNKNCVIFYPEDPVPGDECGGFAPAMLDINADGFRVRLSYSKDDICKYADAVPDFSYTDWLLQELRKIDEPVTAYSLRQVWYP